MMRTQQHHAGCLRAPANTQPIRGTTRAQFARQHLHQRRRLEFHRARAESRQSSATDASDDVLAEEMAEFLRQQAEKESGGRLAVPAEEPTEVLGTDVVPDEVAKRLCREVMNAVKQLRKTRDMSINEVKLTLAIEDPTSREKREYLGIEDGAGVSRDEVASALLDVTAGRIPRDRLALRELHREVTAWPYLGAEEELQEEQQAESNYEGITDTGVKKSDGWRSGQARPPIGRDKNEAPQSLTDMLPEWMGYGFLYFVSTIPVLIVVVTIAILFFSSLS